MQKPRCVAVPLRPLLLGLSGQGRRGQEISKRWGLVAGAPVAKCTDSRHRTDFCEVPPCNAVARFSGQAVNPQITALLCGVSLILLGTLRNEHVVSESGSANSND